MNKMILVILAVIFLTGALTGCNAVRGVGQDMSDAGQHIQKIGQ